MSTTATNRKSLVKGTLGTNEPANWQTLVNANLDTLDAATFYNAAENVSGAWTFAHANGLTLSAAASRIVPGATSLSIRNNANDADNLLVSNAGVVTARAGLVATAGGLDVTGNSTLRGAGVKLTWDTGTAAQAAALRDNAGKLTLDTDGSTDVLRFHQSGCLEMGAATGTDTGTGTINVQNNVYKNGGAYANPDYVLEHWATGRIVTHADKDGAAEYRGRMDLPELRAYLRQRWHLPGFGQEAGLGLFDGGDRLLARLEEAYLYLFDLHDRLAGVEAELAALRAAD